MTPLLAPFQVAVVLLALGGALKLVDPHDTARALRAFHLPGSPLLVRGVAAVEVVVGVVALVWAPPVAVGLVLASYLGFAGFVEIARRRALPIASCGCFGRAEGPPGALHVALNLAAALAALGVLVAGGAPLAEVLGDQPLAGVPYVALVATGVWCAFLAFTTLPQVLALTRVDGER